MKTIQLILRTGVFAGLLSFATSAGHASGAYIPQPPPPRVAPDSAMQHGMHDKMMKVLVNADANGLALVGHDPVAFFTDRKPVPGRPEFSFAHGGATYRFASADNLAKFRAAPEKYAPQFGGYCAYAAARGQLAPVDVNAFLIVDGRLLMQKSTSIRDEFKKDETGNLKKADRNWPKLVEAKGR